MGLYGFKKRFVPKIKAGTKRHTIRGDRAHEDKPGDTMHLYYGLRTTQCELIARVKCTKVEPIRINEWSVFINGQPLFADECEQLALADGFDSFKEMMTFWDGRLPFDGKIYHWKPLEEAC